MLEFDDKNPYLKMDAGGAFFENAPSNLIKNKDLVLKSNEWENKGFNVKLTSRPFIYQVFYIGSYWYTFDYCMPYFIRKDEKFIEAILQRKKHITFEIDVYLNKKLGVDYEEMVSLPDDIIYFSDSHLLFDCGDFKKALDKINLALKLNPTNYHYNNLYFNIQFKLVNLNTVDELLKYYENDLDGIIHSGDLIKWIRLLAKHKQFNKVKEIISITNSTLDKLYSNIIQPKIHSKARKEWYLYKKQQFNKTLEKLIIRVNKYT